MLVTALLLMTLSWIAGFAPHPQSAQAESCSGGAAGDQVTESPCDGQVGTSVAVTVDFKCATGGLPFLTWDGSSIGSGYQVTTSVPSDDVPGAHTISAGCNNGIHLLDAAPTVTFAVDPPTIRASPSSGRAGSTFDIVGQGWPTNCSPITYGFDGNTVSGPTVTVPASTPLGGRSVTEQCTSTAGRSSDTVVEARTTFTVLPPRTQTSTSTTSAPTTVTTTTITTTSGTTTSRGTTTTATTGKTSPTTTPSGTTVSTTPSTSSTTASATTSATTTTASTPTGTPTTSSATTSAAGTTPPRQLTLSSLSVSPGENVSASGHGCAAGSAVHLSLGGVGIGQATADASGDYRAPLTLGSVAVGRYTVTALCGAVTAAAPLDVVLVSQVSADTSTLAIIVFVVLLGALLYRRRLLPRPHPSTPTPDEPDEEQP